jgi:DNA-binding LacI/PurR family transcriptional regulator
MTVGIVLNSQSPVTMRRLMELERLLYQYGYAVMIRNGYWNMDVEKSIIDNLLASRVEGVLVVNTTGRTPHLITPLHNAEIPVVSMEALGDDKTHCIIPNRRMGMCNLVSRIISMGHRHIRYIHGMSAITEKEEGIADALADSPSTVDYRMVQFKDISFLHDSVEQSVKDILAANPEVTAVMCSNDEIAMLAVRTLASLGLRVPQDISVTRFDDIPAASYFLPSITTVSHPVEAQAHRAVEVLISNIENNVRTSLTELIECPVIVRESISRPKDP